MYSPLDAGIDRGPTDVDRLETIETSIHKNNVPEGKEKEQRIVSRKVKVCPTFFNSLIFCDVFRQISGL